jgi:hypothetical protein
MSGSPIEQTKDDSLLFFVVQDVFALQNTLTEHQCAPRPDTIAQMSP